MFYINIFYELLKNKFKIYIKNKNILTLTLDRHVRVADQKNY